MLLGAAAEDDPDLQPIHAGSPLSNAQAVDDGVLDGVAQGVVGVVGGVRADDHVRQLPAAAAAACFRWVCSLQSA